MSTKRRKLRAVDQVSAVEQAFAAGALPEEDRRGAVEWVRHGDGSWVLYKRPIWRSCSAPPAPWVLYKDGQRVIDHAEIALHRATHPEHTEAAP